MRKKKIIRELRQFKRMNDRFEEIIEDCEHIEVIPSIPTRPPNCLHPDGFGICQPRLCPRMDEWLKKNGMWEEAREFRDLKEDLKEGSE